MEVKSRRLEMNAINIISRFLFHNKIKYAVNIKIFLNCKFFVLCPKLKLALQYKYWEYNYGGIQNQILQQKDFCIENKFKEQDSEV